jgi:hypothetical protein
MKAWGESAGATGKVELLSDWNAAFVKALKLDNDLSANGLGVRSKRFVAIVNDGKIVQEDVEAANSQLVRQSHFFSSPVCLFAFVSQMHCEFCRVGPQEALNMELSNSFPDFFFFLFNWHSAL